MITVGDKPVALAGVMGGRDTEIDDTSKNVVLGAAIFDGTSIRKTSGRFNLCTESSSRIEKGVNYATVLGALDIAAAMLTELAGGATLAGRVVAGNLPTEPTQVSSSLSYVNARLGTDLTADDIKDIFKKLGFGLEISGDNFTVSVPRRRWDISIQVDLVEEIARI